MTRELRRSPAGSWMAFHAFLAIVFATQVHAQPRRISSAERVADEDEGGPGASTTGENDAPAPARAPLRAYVIAVPTSEGLEAVAQRAGAAARASLRTIEGVDWQSADRLFLGYDESAVPTLARARERLQAGREAYLNLEMSQAIESLTAAVADFDAAASALEDPNDLGQALLFLGASLAFEGRHREAQRVFGRLHVQMPFLRPDPNLFNPDVIARFESARPRGSASSSIVVESDPPGAIAYVDFLARGVTPITVSGLFPGEHVVRVTRAGAVPSVQPVTVAARRTAAASAMLVDEQATAGLVDALAGVATQDVSSIAPGTPIHNVATMLGVERIGVIRASAGETPETVQLELVVFDVGSGRRLVRGAGTAPTAVGELEPAVDRLVSGALEAAVRASAVDETAMHRPPLREEEAPPLFQAPPPSGPSVFEEPTFWAVVGGVLVAAGAGVAIGVVASNQGPGLGSSPAGQVVFEF